MIPPLTLELVPVYRCGLVGKRLLTRHGAYMRAAWAAIIRERNRRGERVQGCGCGPWDPLTGNMDPWCRLHGDDQAHEFARRLARWLRWRDGRRAAMETT